MTDCLNMADSVKIVEEENQKRIHSRAPSGHVHKGHGVVAANASIPTKYQTIVVDKADKKGFLAKSKRFHTDDHFTDAPAPGVYVNHGKFDKLSPSFSKKGTGGFASKSKRATKFVMANGPGPGIYSLPSMLTTRRDFNRGVHAAFAQPIAEQVDKANGVPPPNIYNVLRTKPGKANNVTADAAFKSKSKREMLNLSEQARVPAPGQYNVNDAMRHESVKVPFSSFKSQSKRELMARPEAYPGPGHYKPDEGVEPANRLIYPRKHYLCISAPAMPMPQTPPLPGPGSYELVDFEGPGKHYMSSAAFVSTSSRWTGQAPIGLGEQPGPAHYRPVPVGKQSFIYNAAGRWI
ncbi:O(6)-methylguanine-induced apoptosis 2-like [Babylonia areolata]|uniref:O(6)-methylguanine-induced apoptosis 2-like n=1 Tax=Babylonia areolata TaxID=304850 RepID=UPI003FCF4D14